MLFAVFVAIIFRHVLAASKRRVREASAGPGAVRVRKSGETPTADPGSAEQALFSVIYI